MTSTSKKVLVSVAIPFYNQERYVAETLTSVLNQKTDFDYEVVCGDDGSSDMTRSILEDFQKCYPDKIFVLFNKTNLGLLINVKNILDNCRGKYIALLGGDDLFLRADKLQLQYDFLENNSDYGLVHSDCNLLVEKPFAKPNIIGSWREHKKIQIKTGYVFNDLIIRNFIVASTAFFRRELYSFHADFETWRSMGFMMEDYPMWLEFSKKCKFGYISEPLSTYRLLFNTVSRPKGRKKFFNFWKSSFEVRRYFIKKYGADEQVYKNFMKIFYLFYLDYAFIFRDKKMSAEAIEYFRSEGKMTRLMGVYDLGIKVWPIWFFIRIGRKFTKYLRIR